MMHVFLTALALLFWVVIAHGHTWVFTAIAISAIWNDYRQRHVRAAAPAASARSVAAASIGPAAPPRPGRRERVVRADPALGVTAAPLRGIPPVRAYRRDVAAARDARARSGDAQRADADSR